MKLKLEIDVVIVDDLSDDAVARVFYGDEPGGSRIEILKGLNAMEVSEAIHHEIGHVLDWYMGRQSTDSVTREQNAIVIGESIRFRETSQ